jgi:hypothetical protein
LYPFAHSKILGRVKDVVLDVYIRCHIERLMLARRWKVYLHSSTEPFVL